jgi:prolipoprotein diacylglyceryltransferase
MGQLLSIPFILTGIVLFILTMGKRQSTISTDNAIVGGEEIRIE